MLRAAHLILLKIAIAGCLTPAVASSDGGLLRNFARAPQSFRDALANYPAIIRRLDYCNKITRALVKSSLSIALILHKTRSFKLATQHVFKVLGGAPAFSEGAPTPAPVVQNLESDNNSYRSYVDFITERSAQEHSADFVQLIENGRAATYPTDIKLIAFYLPQFHAFPLNDEWYGRGFTEWTNVTKAIPQYTDHYQPQLPIDMGYYNLNDVSVMHRQVELAKLYGIHAFCFHYYWFSGARLMEKPIFSWLENQDIDFPFCLNWANENWSKLWDGGNREVRYKQELLPGDDEKFFSDILPFFKDRRYIKIQGKPLLLIYRPHLFSKERCQQFVKTLREKSVENGFPGLYIVSVNSHSFQEDPTLWGLDAMAEFPPHCMLNHGLKEKPLNGFVNPHFNGHVFDGADYVTQKRYLYETDYKLFKGVSPSWDNTPRKAYSNASVIDNITPEIYQEWLSGCITHTREKHSEDERFIFINAWNEWAEGAHLEPDSRYGYAYLQATKNALTREDA
ncbi:glycosyltransferase WbsX family protein [Pseudomonas citronellolis]|uniref:glycosyltransferase WbsX family protein n=1 Tax=Pseudomonas citronellolis TaxID=53408 RepID=UPI0023E400C5|nr:glycoside hydrolase family 99-like domain-containing protein [Pseudomonas citronellolis]MDF3935309.1 glycoside hydrolase family 99-like domain-containing protein [Pseudomonas citronellolis]